MIFGLGKKRSNETFKDRVTAFWDWYAKVADRFYQSIEQSRCEDLTGEVGKFMDKTMTGLSWVFGPGENGGHSFTVTGEGQVPKQLLAAYWQSRAPQIPNWTFYASRQATPPDQLKDFSIAVGDANVDVEGFLLKTSVDDEAKVIDIVAWHPALKGLPEEHQYTVLFILLDEALGEFGTQTWLGEIKIEPFQRGTDTKTIATLPLFIDQVQKYHRWQKLPPLESYSVYQMPEQSRTPRGDTVTGTTCIPNVISEFPENDGRLPEDPLEGTGAEFAYVEIDGAVFPEGRQSEVRGNIEDALDDALTSQLSGRTLGGAFGLNKSYVDLLLFDGDNSRQIIQQTLESLQLRGRSQIKSFV